MTGRDHFLTGITQRIIDEEGKLTEPDLEGCLDQALQEYSHQRPQDVVANLTGSGSAFLDVPGDWEETFSQVTGLYELDSENKPTVIPKACYQVIAQPGGNWEIFYFEGTFESGTTYRLEYTIMQTITADTTSVPSADHAALMDLAASHAMYRMAAAYLQSIAQTLSTVTFDYRSKPREYREMAKTLREKYEQAMNADAVRGAGRMKTWTPQQSLTDWTSP